MPHISKEEEVVVNDMFNELTNEDLNTLKGVIKMVKKRKGIFEDIKIFGPNLHASSCFIVEKTGLPRKASGLLARELWFLTKPGIDRGRHFKLGIKHAIWIYEGYLCKYPSHSRFNNKKFLLEKGVRVGLFKRLNTGQLVGCRCMYRPVLPGIDM